jgi:DNA ligase-4
VQRNLERSCAQICDSKLNNRFPLAQPKEEHLRRWLALALGFIKPEVGVNIGPGEFVKALSCKHAGELARGRKIIMERKYDGEFCQIHIDLTKDRKHQIKIFSKKGRDSTQDRIAIHEPLRTALGLDDESKRSSLLRKACILAGELVVYSSRERKIMPFHYLRSHIARGGRFIGNVNDAPASPNSHLMILLFDVLLIDDLPLLYRAQSERIDYLRRILVAPRAGFCEIVQSTVIDFSQGGRAHQKLKECFTTGIRKRWEGFVLKPADAPFIDALELRPDKASRGHGFYGSKNAWIKLKKDYIQGLGDTVDFAIIGGAISPGRSFARNQSAGDLSTFHAAVLMNNAEVEKYGAKPKLKVMFEVSYSIQKVDLEWIQRCAYFNGIEYEVIFLLN